MLNALKVILCRNNILKMGDEFKVALRNSNEGELVTTFFVTVGNALLPLVESTRSVGGMFTH